MAIKSVRYPLRVLSDLEVEKIYQSSVTVLQETGVFFEDEKVINHLRELGCHVDSNRKRVYFLPDVIEQSLSACPAEFMVKARITEHDLMFNGTNVFFASHSAPKIIDSRTGKQRQPVLQDIRDMLTVIDALDNFNVLLTLTGELADKPAEVGPEWVFAETFRRTRKTTVGPSFRDCPKWIIEMARIVGVDIIGITSCSPPLGFPKQESDALQRYAEAGFPVTVGTGIALGGTGPVTLAGTLVQQTAEALAGVVLVQSLHPGTGVFYLTETAPIDMRYGDIAWGSIEVALLHAAQGQISRRLGLQNISLFPMTGSMLPDQQVGYEKGMQSIIMALSGINFISGGGGVYNEASLCLEQLVIDNDIYGMVARFLDGINISDDAFAIDIIREVVAEGGSYLKNSHTRTQFKKEHFFPQITNRQSYQTWSNMGAKDVVQRAKDRVQQIFRKHEVVPLPDEVERELTALLKKVEKERLEEKH